MDIKLVKKQSFSREGLVLLASHTHQKVKMTPKNWIKNFTVHVKAKSKKQKNL